MPRKGTKKTVLTAKKGYPQPERSEPREAREFDGVPHELEGRYPNRPAVVSRQKELTAQGKSVRMTQEAPEYLLWVA